MSTYSDYSNSEIRRMIEQARAIEAKTPLLQAIIDLTSEVGEWSSRNFPHCKPDHSVLGIYEELGELAHAALKRNQGIRGTEEKHIADAADALADMWIFAMDAMWRFSTAGGCDLNSPGSLFSGVVEMMSSAPAVSKQIMTMTVSAMSVKQHGWDFLSRQTIHAMAMAAGQLSEAILSASIAQSVGDERQASSCYSDAVAAIVSMFTVSEVYAVVVLGKQADDLLRETWAKVKQRDWTANPADAHQKAEANTGSV